MIMSREKQLDNFHFVQHFNLISLSLELPQESLTSTKKGLTFWDYMNNKRELFQK